ncbi:MAG TPA: 4Fe-4S cluster-binding domain-containing protein [Anaerolineales bacterium]|nr:4Fe-4S cluster-binding domain-containing protein [Anaerolineales bacterium]
MEPLEPAYLSLLHSGELEKRAASAHAGLAECRQCAWACRANRLAGKTGACKTGLLAEVSSYGAHPGEERPISGSGGSGTVFFARCNLRCQYCQNAEISQLQPGEPMSPEALAGIFLELQAQGCHNINLVSPSHVVTQILAAVLIAARQGLNLPLVYNTGGYDSLDALHLLDGVIDIYMPDMKYSSAAIAKYYSKIPNYPQVNQAAVREMYRQVGDLMLDEHGLARRGLLIRHLVLPGDLAGSAEILHFIAADISPDTYLNLMDQYHPAFNARLYPRLRRPVSQAEYRSVVELAQKTGLKRFHTD